MGLMSLIPLGAEPNHPAAILVFWPIILIVETPLAWVVMLRLMLANPLNSLIQKVAERVGFEPTLAFAKTVFKTVAINHSTTSPLLCRSL